MRETQYAVLRSLEGRRVAFEGDRIHQLGFGTMRVGIAVVESAIREYRRPETRSKNMTGGMPA